MTTGLIRYYGSNDLHFITCSCYQRKPLLGTAQRRDLFLCILEETRKKYRFVISAYVVMPEHFHLLVTEPQIGDPSKVMQVVKQRFAHSVLSAEGTRSSPAKIRSEQRHVWQTRFYDYNVWTEKKRIEKVRYIHRNPVERRLVGSPEEWHWSSFRYYKFGEAGVVQVNDTELMKMRVTPSGNESTLAHPSQSARGVGHPRL